MNHCPCGYLGSRHFYCTCTPKQITSYTNRVSGPIQDRMDMMLRLETESLESDTVATNETSTTIRNRVVTARVKQYERYGREVCNAVVSTEKLLESSQLDSDQQKMMRQWSSENNWSRRVQMKVLRLARTISDLSGMEKLTNESLWEAMTLKRSERKKDKRAKVN